MIDINKIFDYGTIDQLESVGKINIGEMFYKLNQGYNDLWRVDNIYPYGVDLKHVNHKNKKYVDFNTLVKEYIKIAPHGFIEFSAIKHKQLDYWDLRVSILNYDIDHDEIRILSSGLLFTPIEVFGEYKYYQMTNPILTDDSFDDPIVFFDKDLYIMSKNYRICIAYYFGDTIKSILDFTDEVILNYIDKCRNSYKEFLEKNLITPNVDISKLGDLDKMLRDNEAFVLIGYEHGVDYIESEYGSLEINKYDMFEDKLIYDSLVFNGIPDYPYFVYEYKVFMNLNDIANDASLVMTLDENREVRFFVVMTFKTSKKIL